MADGTLRTHAVSVVNDTLQRAVLTDYALDGAELSEHVHTNSAYPTVRLEAWGMHEEGTYNLIRYNLGAGGQHNVSARTADHLLNDFILDLDDGFRTQRRTGGGMLYVQPEGDDQDSRYFILDEDGETTYFSPFDDALRYHRIAEAGDDVVVTEEVNVGGGFTPAVTRFTADGTLVYRTLYNSTHGVTLGLWPGARIGVGPDGDIGIVTRVSGTLVIARLSPAGDLLWETEYDPAGSLYPNDVAFDSAGNLIVAGRLAPAAGQSDASLVKFDPSGTLLWANSYAGNGYENAAAVTVLDDDSIVVSGSHTEIAGATDAWLARIAP